MAKGKRKEANDLKEANRLLAYVEEGNGSVLRQRIDGKMETIILARSGSPICSIGKNYCYMFDAFVQQHGNKDGLFDWSSQTAQKH